MPNDALKRKVTERSYMDPYYDLNVEYSKLQDTKHMYSDSELTNLARYGKSTSVCQLAEDELKERARKKESEEKKHVKEEGGGNSAKLDFSFKNLVIAALAFGGIWWISPYKPSKEKTKEEKIREYNERTRQHDRRRRERDTGTSRQMDENLEKAVQRAKERQRRLRRQRQRGESEALKSDTMFASALDSVSTSTFAVAGLFGGGLEKLRLRKIEVAKAEGKSPSSFTSPDAHPQAIPINPRIKE